MTSIPNLGQSRLAKSAILCFFLAASQNGHSATNLVTNGSFETTSQGTNLQLGYSSGPAAYKTDAVGWTNDGYNFIVGPGAADTTGVTGSYGNLQFWGTNNGGLTTIPLSSPDGGNYIAADGAFGVDAVTQSISGLTVGQTYLLTFYWAAGQQEGFDGDTTSKLEVSLGAETYTTATLNVPNHGFIDWMTESHTFTASNTTSVLSFLAVGTPDGVPPFALFDGVSLTQVPEPSLGMLSSLAFCGLAFRRRRR